MEIECNSCGDISVIGDGGSMTPFEIAERIVTLSEIEKLRAKPAVEQLWRDVEQSAKALVEGLRDE